MRKIRLWKLVCIITSTILILFISIVLWNLISAYMAKVTYPYPALGIDIYNWFDRFLLNTAFVIYIFGIPVIIDIVIMIISIVKIKKSKKEI